MGSANGALALCVEVRVTVLLSALSRRFLELCQRFRDKCITGGQGLSGCVLGSAGCLTC